MKAGRVAGLIGLLTLIVTAHARAHEPILLDSRHATPGLLLRLAELPSETAEPRRYRLEPSGLPPGLTFSVWTKDFGHTFHEVVSGLVVDPSGALVAAVPDADGRRQRLDEMPLTPGPYPPGAIWEVALVSTDRTQLAFTKVVPRPLRAEAGSCAVSVQLVSHRGERFLASGEGFVPGDEVLIESRVAERVVRRRQRVGTDGRLRSEVLSHVPVGGDRTARYAVTGQRCAVAIEYVWGARALERQ
jgi:hypothetical protein